MNRYPPTEARLPAWFDPELSARAWFDEALGASVSSGTATLVTAGGVLSAFGGALATEPTEQPEMIGCPLPRWTPRAINVGSAQLQSAAARLALQGQVAGPLIGSAQVLVALTPQMLAHGRSHTDDLDTALILALLEL